MITRLEELVCELQQRGVGSIDRFLNRLSGRLSSEKGYLDILKEGRFAKILARNGFKEIEIEYCKEGPDIKAKYNKRTIYFEIARKRENEREQKLQERGEAGFFLPYRTDNIISAIQEKLKQLQSGELNIVVLWSDTVRLGLLEIKEAIKYIQREIKAEPEKYKELSGVLFTDGTDTATLKQFHLFKNDKASKQLPDRLIKKLGKLLEEDPGTLQREAAELAAVIKRRLDSRVC